MDCGCGRSPNGKCLGWHDLSEEEYLEKLKEYEASQKVEDQILLGLITIVAIVDYFYSFINFLS